jgi:PTS system sucrose-specific IIC component
LNYEKIAQSIYLLVGPRENILQAENCMTRLRLVLKRRDHIDYAALKNIPGVLGVNDQTEELQIILGPGRASQVLSIFKELLHLPPNEEALPPKTDNGEALHAKIQQKNATPFKLLLKRISSIFMPLIPAFIACGLITGLLNVFLKIQPEFSQSAAFSILQICGSAVFWGINLFVGVNAAKEFGASPMLGGTLAAIISHPGLSSIELFGTTLVPGRGGIIAVLLVVAFSSWLEKKLHQYIPEIFDLFLTPLLVILLTSPIALLLLQPLGGIISESIGKAATTAVTSGGMLTGFFLGGTFLPLVMTGLHQGLTPIHAELLNQSGVTILLPILAMAGAGQVGASAAVYFRTKNSRLKKIIVSALPVGLMGVGEPLIYGVTLPLFRPFIAACLGGAFGGAVQAFNLVGATSIGLSGLPLAASTNNIPGYFAGLLTAYIVGFLLTYIIGFNDPEE